MGKPASTPKPLTHEGPARFGAAAMPLCGYIPYRGVCILPEGFYDIGNPRGISYIIRIEFL